MPGPPPDDPLLTRTGLPAELRLLLDDHPREDWHRHPDFNGLAAFWLDRHQGFRQMMGVLQADAQGVLDRRIAPEACRPRLARLGSEFLSHLTGHHQIEDHSYFPMLTGLEPRLTRGFDLLDRDHHDLHARIEAFAADANTLLQTDTDPALHEAAGRLLATLDPFARMLERHLTDEEDLVLPVVLKHGVG